jgi:uncharacterized DUF497 family protein
MLNAASFYFDNKLYAISNGGYAYVFYEKDGKQKIQRISAREFEDRRAERYDY